MDSGEQNREQAKPVYRRLLEYPHLATRRWVGAILGCVLTPCAFRYALMNGCIARYAPGVSEGDPLRVTISIGVGVVLLVAFAMLTARWASRGTRASAMSVGAVVGSLIGGFTYATVGAPAAGVAGSTDVLSLMSQPTDVIDETMVMNAWFGCTIWTYGLGWAMLLVGGTLGALAGAVVGSPQGSGRETRSSSFTGRVVLSMLIIMCCLVLFASVPVHAVLASGFVDAVAGMGYELPASPRLMWDAPVGSSIVVLLILLVAAAYSGWRHRPSSSSRAWYDSRLYYSLGVVIMLTFDLVALTAMKPFLSVLGIGMLVVGCLGLLLIVLGERYSLAAEQKDVEAMRVPGVMEVITSSLVGATALVSLLQFLGSGLALNLTLTLIRALPYTVTERSTNDLIPLSPIQLARETYDVHIVYTLRAWAVLCLVLLLGVISVHGLVRIRERRRSRGKQSSGLGWSIALLGLLAVVLPLSVGACVSLTLKGLFH